MEVMQSTYYIEETNEDVTDKIVELFDNCEHCVKRVAIATRLWNRLFNRDQFRRLYYVELEFREEIIKGFKKYGPDTRNNLEAYKLLN